MTEEYLRNKIREMLLEQQIKLHQEEKSPKQEKSKRKTNYPVMSRPVKGVGRGRFGASYANIKAKSENVG